MTGNIIPALPVILSSLCKENLFGRVTERRYLMSSLSLKANEYSLCLAILKLPGIRILRPSSRRNRQILAISETFKCSKPSLPNIGFFVALKHPSE